jgi:pantoate--beta-alanine ligase
MSAETVTILQNVAGLRAQVADWRKAGESIALVPTMGALHSGHISLVEEAKRRAQRVVMSIFVNPTQFAPNEDFNAYPRQLETDVAKFAGAGGDCVYAPLASEIYPQGFATTVSLAGPACVGLEDRFRPSHFAGVATVVAKLLNQCRPDVAIFGEKDFQQFKVVSRMVIDLDLDVGVIGAPTLREADGLALSSRNAYLSPEERKIAPLLFAALTRCAAAMRQGMEVQAAVEAARSDLDGAGFVTDYIEVRHAECLTTKRRFAS